MEKAKIKREAPKQYILRMFIAEKKTLFLDISRRCWFYRDPSTRIGTLMELKGFRVLA